MVSYHVNYINLSTFLAKMSYTIMIILPPSILDKNLMADYWLQVKKGPDGQ